MTLTEHRMADGPDIEDPEAVARWEVTDDNAAEWALETRAEALAEIARCDHWRDQKVAAVEERHRLATQDPHRTIAVMDAKLIDYRLRLEAENPKLPKSYRLPSGTLTRRLGSVRSVITDPTALAQWCGENLPDALRSTVLTSEVAKACEATIGKGPGSGVLVADGGEVVPGIEQTRGDDTYTVVPADTSGEPWS